jgi:hypothetical protein
MKVKIIKTVNTRHGYGEVEYFSYQFAFGVSIRCFSGGWMFRLYMGQFKIWFNLR